MEGPARPLRILIADDHPLIRRALRRDLESGRLEVCAEAGTGPKPSKRRCASDPTCACSTSRCPGAGPDRRRGDPPLAALGQGRPDHRGPRRERCPGGCPPRAPTATWPRTWTRTGCRKSSARSPAGKPPTRGGCSGRCCAHCSRQAERSDTRTPDHHPRLARGTAATVSRPTSD